MNEIWIGLIFAFSVTYLLISLAVAVVAFADDDPIPMWVFGAPIGKLLFYIFKPLFRAIYHFSKIKEYKNDENWVEMDFKHFYTCYNLFNSDYWRTDGYNFFPKHRYTIVLFNLKDTIKYSYWLRDEKRRLKHKRATSNYDKEFMKTLIHDLKEYSVQEEQLSQECLGNFEKEYIDISKNLLYNNSTVQ